MTVSLSGESEQVVSVDVEIGVLDLIANRMATPSEDYYLDGAPSGVLTTNITFAPFETVATFHIGIVDDIPYEGEEWLSIHLFDPVNALLGEDYDQYTSDIWMDDVEDPYIVVMDVETFEPLAPGEPAYASFRVEMMGGMGGETSEVTWTTTVGHSASVLEVRNLKNDGKCNN